MSAVNVDAQTMANARTLGRTQTLLTRSMNRLSSGSRIVNPADDPGRIGLAAKLTSQNQRIKAAETNVQNAASLLQSTDGFMKGMGSLLTRMGELVLLSSDAMKSGQDAALYNEEFRQIQDQLRSAIGGSTAEIGGTTGIPKPLGMFNGNVLFGANPGGLLLATGQGAGQNLVIPEFNLRNGDMVEMFRQDASGNYMLSISDPGVIAKIEAAMNDLADERATVGGVQSRLDLIGKSLTVESENIETTLSRIQDVDVATESTRLSKYQMLAEAGTAMLTQAASSPRSILKLLKE